jgi:uncharacterized protein YqjF (DUF2071 family)
MAPSRISPGAAVRHLLSRGAGAVVGYQRWHDLLFLHWEVPPEAVRPLVDARLPLDLLDGRAWLSLTPFTVRGARLRGLPPVPPVAAFHEVNLRTYVRPDGGQPGIWFASLDAASALASAAARASLGLPYFPARIDRGETGVEHHYRCDRVALRGEGASVSARWTVGAPVENRPGSVEHFLAERSEQARRVQGFLRTLAREGEPDLAGLTLAVRQLRSME